MENIIRSTEPQDFISKLNNNFNVFKDIFESFRGSVQTCHLFTDVEFRIKDAKSFCYEVVGREFYYEFQIKQIDGVFRAELEFFEAIVELDNKVVKQHIAKFIFKNNGEVCDYKFDDYGVEDKLDLKYDIHAIRFFNHNLVKSFS